MTTDSSHSHVKSSGTSTASQYLPRTDAKLADHEKRIAALEAKLAVPPPVVVTPPPVIVPGPITDLQAAIDSAATGAVIDCSGSGVFGGRRYTVGKAITLKGARIDGAGVGVPSQQGLLTVTAAGAILEDVHVKNSPAAGLQVSGTGVIVRSCEFSYCRENGINISLAAGTSFLGGSLHHNGVGGDPGIAGGCKVHGSSILFDGVEVYSNQGPGLWWDQWYPTPYPPDRVFNPGAIARNCRIHHNSSAGLHYEISDGGDFYANMVWENGWGDNRGWGWPAGILMSSSRNAKIHDNVVAWNAVGISLVSQNRGDNPGTPIGLVATNNVIAGRAPCASYVDWSPPASSFTTSPNTIVLAGDARLVGVPASPEAGHS